MTKAKRSGLLSVALRVAGVVLAALVLWGAMWVYQSQKPPAQPVQFNHQRHVQDLGMSCLYCHSNAQRGVSAGLPSLTKCMACHNSIKPKTAAEKRLHEFA
ncbi:MAG: cytochrome c3 family protein, partial [Chloroflexi bacterium]|nr:cytochrome c3 family protein [Chloroflexota bacterium]